LELEHPAERRAAAVRRRNKQVRERHIETPILKVGAEEATLRQNADLSRETLL
jgi:hypothetical protein